MLRRRRHPDVVGLVEAVEADGEAGTDRSRCIRSGRLPLTPRPSAAKCNNVAAVGGQFGDLLFVDQGADDVGVALHGQRIGFDGDGLRFGTNCQLDVDTECPGNINDDALLLVVSNPLAVIFML